MRNIFLREVPVSTLQMLKMQRLLRDKATSLAFSYTSHMLVDVPNQGVHSMCQAACIVFCVRHWLLRDR